MPQENALCFGGGGLVGTAKALGHLIGLDQVVRDRASQGEVKKSFFDYMGEAQVPLDQLEARFEEVLDRIPPEVMNGQADHIPRYFKLCCGISGGSFLAASVVSEIPLVELLREAVHFPVNYYFRPDFKEYWRALRNLPKIPIEVAKITMRELYPRFERGSGEGWVLPILRRASRYTAGLISTYQQLLPRGIFTGEGIEEYVEKMATDYGLRNSFQDIRSRGRHLFVIAERFNTASRLTDDQRTKGTAIYFGMPPHDNIPVSRAIRASCSIPGITTPMEYVDPERGGTRFLLVDGAIAKTIGRRRLFESFDIGVAVVVNPIVPYIGQLDNIIDNMEQLYRKILYSRLKAVEAHIEKEVERRTVHIESNPDDFFYNMLRMDKIKEGLFEGYFQTLRLCASQYSATSERLALGGLCLIPRAEIVKQLNKNAMTREHAQIVRRQALDKEKVSVQLGTALSGLFRSREDAA